VAFISLERKKILYLDECHDISRQGQDVLLKQVEQCPPHLIYLFSTTEIEKLRPTLKKRCIQFQFSKVSSDQIFNRLKHISNIEKITCEEEALRMIADRAEGHVRDALKLLEEASCLGPVTVNTVTKISVDYSSEIFDILINLGSDLPKSIEICRKVASFISATEFYNQLITLVCDAVKLSYGYCDFLPKRKVMLEKLNAVHGSNLVEFLNYMISREKYVDKVGLQGDIILLHYKFCTNSFKPQIPEQNVSVSPSMVQNPPVEQVSSSSMLTHAKLMTYPLSERIKILQKQRSISHNTPEKEETQKIASEWSLPKSQRQGSDSSDVIGQELSPLDFSRLMVGGRGGGTI